MPPPVHPSFILASASPRRLRLLEQIGVAPGAVIPAAIDEMPRQGELPVPYVRRMAREKAAAVASRHPDAPVLAADTVAACGRRLLPKCEDEAAVRRCLALLSGRRHRVYTALCVISPEGTRAGLVMTQVQFGRLSAVDINGYIASGEWRGKAGGYAIQGRAEAFILRINGSYSNVVGLPLAETRRMLKQAGFSL